MIMTKLRYNQHTSQAIFDQATCFFDEKNQWLATELLMFTGDLDFYLWGRILTR